MCVEFTGPGRGHIFRMSFAAWDKVLAEALKKGWLPRGTTPDPDASGWQKNGLSQSNLGYEVEDSIWAKHMASEDAADMAVALERYRNNQLQHIRDRIAFGSPTEDTAEHSPISLDYWGEFIDYLKVGACKFFAWDS